LKLSLLIDFNPRVNVVARICRKLYGDDPAHGWPHILRVMAWAERIVNSEGLDVDPEVLVVSVLLHDIGRLYEDSDHHAIRGSEVASAILEVFFQLHVPNSSGREGPLHQPQTRHVRHLTPPYH
jgi:HD superfamily phosphodiesterase